MHSFSAIQAITLVFLVIVNSPVFGQKVDTKSHELAIERIEEATKVLTDVAALPDDKGIPKDIRDNAFLIGIVPGASRLSLLVSRATSGHGILSTRDRAKNWGLPVYISYYSAPGFKFSSAGAKNLDIIFVVTIEKPTEPTKTQKDGSSKSKSDSVKGKHYTYAFTDGDLKLINTETLFNDSFFGLSGFFKDTSHWKNDETLNKAVYGAKGREVDAGKITGPKFS
ncbi:MAG TPA: hypothetical protein VGQ55_02315, partial [Pyrinomonadaceae bacterium]|nr:hypothetical protein [Pyrinomonadaceae bacterium]